VLRLLQLQQGKRLLSKHLQTPLLGFVQLESHLLNTWLLLVVEGEEDTVVAAALEVIEQELDMQSQLETLIQSL
jgi:hypothetical protein